MWIWQQIREALPPGFGVEPTAGADFRLLINHQPGVEFHVVETKTLTREAAEQAITSGQQAAGLQRLVVFERSSPEARRALRNAGISYAGRDGRLLLQAPRIWVERDQPLRVSRPDWDADASASRNPFAVRSSRVARWLLLHPEQTFTVGSLAAHTELSVPAVSRVVQALDDLAVVSRTTNPDDARSRVVSVSRPQVLLDTWLNVWQRRRIKRASWDIGARDADEALSKLRSLLVHHPSLEVAIGGLAGAAEAQRAVEPANVTVWIDEAQMTELRAELVAESARAERGSLRVSAAPDPWTLRLATTRSGLPVADPVQLWLDCASEGERATEAAAAVARTMAW